MKIVNGFYITAKIQKEERAWVKGTIAPWSLRDNTEYEFTALVFDENSSHGIKGGRTSKLWVKQKGTKGLECVNYDRGWDTKPKTAKEKKLVEALLAYFDTLPTAAFWEDVVATQPQIIEYLRLASGHMDRCRITIDNEGWGTIQDVFSYNWHGKLDPIAVWELLEERKRRNK